MAISNHIVSTTTAVLTSAEVIQYIFKKHHVFPNCQSQSVEGVAHRLFGVHAARLPTPYVSLFPRVEGFQAKMLWRNLHVDRTLIKLRCMRRTLHILPLELAPIAHQATKEFRISECLSRYKKLSIEPPVISDVKEIILALAASGPVSPRDLLQQVPSRMSRLTRSRHSDQQVKELIAAATKELWESGALSYRNANEHWSREDRFYELTRTAYPDLDLDAVGEKEARRLLIYGHIARYGPVTVKDISWWSGLGTTVIRQVIEEMADQICAVQIEQAASVHYMTVDDWSAFLAQRKTGGEWVALLAYEDPTLKGYFESRRLYMDLRHYERLFNKIGESRASVVINGKVAGTWEWEKKRKRINISYFEPISRRDQQRVAHEIEKMECFLRA